MNNPEKYKKEKETGGIAAAYEYDAFGRITTQSRASNRVNSQLSRCERNLSIMEI